MKPARVLDDAILPALHPGSYRMASLPRPLSCVSCGSEQITCLGELAASIRFAGRTLATPLPGGALYACRRCHLAFRFPLLPQDQLDELYRQGDPALWQYVPEKRPDWHTARAYLQAHHQGGDVLDVGCFDGAFLAYLGPAWQRFGVEIHEAAARQAAQRGVRLVGRDIAQIGQIERRFDAVTAFDVIEHVADPRRLLEAMAALVRPGGVVILSSGNRQARAWQFMGSRYWYCNLPEHLAFIGETWCRGAAEGLGLNLVRLEPFSHEDRQTLGRRASDVLKNAFYRFWPGLFGALRKMGLGEPGLRRREALKRFPPMWMTARDHLVAIFQKP